VQPSTRYLSGLPAHSHFVTHQDPQGLLHTAALNLFSPQSVLVLQVASIQLQDLALGLVEPHEVHAGPLLKPVSVNFLKKSNRIALLPQSTRPLLL